MIWIDITNAPHVLFFREFIRDHECLVTTREFGGLTALLDQNNIEYKVIGSHGGKDPRNKLMEHSKRVADLAEHIDAGVITSSLAKHSVELPRVAFGLGIHSVFVLDNEHATAQNRLTLPLVDHIITPEALDQKKILNEGAEKERVKTFYGVCEATHLKGFKPDKRAFKELGDYVVVRPEPYMAAYFQNNMRTQRLVDMLKGSGYNVVVLPRGSEKFSGALHLKDVDSLNLLYHAQAFFGGGGTMNREAAVMGTPAISFYTEQLLGVDKFLLKLGLMHHKTSLDFDVEELLDDHKDQRKLAANVIGTFEDPFEIIEELLK